MFHVSRNVIFSADDFGISPLANKNILHLLKLKKIQRVSVMVNGEFSPKEVKQLLDSRAKLDIHLTLTRQKSPTPPVSSPQLRGGKEGGVGSQSKDIQKRNIIARLTLFLFNCLTSSSANKISANWDSQIKKFQKIFGKAPDGLNSHEHVHFFPLYFKIALKLCQKYKIPHLRFGSKDIPTNRNIISVILKILNYINKRHFSCFKFHVSSFMYLASLDWIINKKNLDSLITRLNNGSVGQAPENDNGITTEIVCHPEREGEYKFLLDKPQSAEF